MTDPTAAQDVTARQALEDALRPLLPADWQIIANERAADDVNRTRLRISQRTIARHPVAGIRAHAVGFTLTITVPGTELEAAEAQLDDDMDSFIWALDAADIAWGTAEKAEFDGRLGYQLVVSISTYRKEQD